MTQEKKQLLLKDLSARLPYGTYVNHKNFPDTKFKVIAVFDNGRIGVTENEIPLTPTSINECKPYLRPFSSMTREEGDELFQLMGNGCDSQRVDFYNSHYLDYRGLIEKDLALEAPEGIYKFE